MTLLASLESIDNNQLENEEFRNELKHLTEMPIGDLLKEENFEWEIKFDLKDDEHCQTKERKVKA